MPEQQFELKPVGIRYVCDKCGEGEMVQSGNIAWMTDPPKVPHKCTKCGFEQAFTEKYPTVRYVTPNVELTGLRRSYGEGPVERRVRPQGDNDE